MKKILSSLLVVFVTLISAINITSSFFSDSEISSGNTFQSGEFDLLVNGQDNPQSIINFIDIKPGDYLTEEKILTIQNPAFAWLHLNELETSQGVETEPEIIDENGVEKHDLENYLLYDLVVGSNNPIISLDDQISFSDVFSCWIPLGNIDVGDTTVLQSFHFEDTVTNWAQGDTLTFSEEFYAEQNRHNPSPTPPESENYRVWSYQLKKCLTNLSGTYNIVYTCTSGCSGNYSHTLNVTSMDTLTGNFTGNGFYNPDNSYTWDVIGNTQGSSINYTLVYTGINPGYTVTAMGTVHFDGSITGTAVSSTGQSFDFLMN